MLCPHTDSTRWGIPWPRSLQSTDVWVPEDGNGGSPVGAQQRGCPEKQLCSSDPAPAGGCLELDRYVSEQPGLPRSGRSRMGWWKPGGRSRRREEPQWAASLYANMVCVSEADVVTLSSDKDGRVCSVYAQIYREDRERVMWLQYRRGRRTGRIREGEMRRERTEVWKFHQCGFKIGSDRQPRTANRIICNKINNHLKAGLKALSLATSESMWDFLSVHGLV